MKKHIILSTLSLFALWTHGSFASSEDAQVVAKIDMKNFQRTLALKTDEGETLQPVPALKADSNAVLVGQAMMDPKILSAEIRYNMKVSPEVTAVEMAGRWEFNQDTLQAIVTYFPHLTSLEYGRFVKVSCLSPLANIAKLQKLVLLGKHDAPLEDLGKILSLTDLKLSEMDLVEVPPSIANLTSLTSLELSDVGLRTVPAFLGGLRLKRLVLSKNNTLNFYGAPTLPTVDILEVRNMNLRSFSFIEKFVPNVQILDISSNADSGVGYAGLPIDARDFANLRSLTSLDTSHNKHDGSQLQILAQALPNLIELKLCGNVGAKTDFDPDVLMDFRQLRKLDVSFCDITDISFINCMKLEVLNLACNGTSEKKLSLRKVPRKGLISLNAAVLGIESLRDLSLHNFPKLQHLDISGNVGEDGRIIELDDYYFKHVADTLTSLEMRFDSIPVKKLETLSVLVNLKALTLTQATIDRNGWPRALNNLPIEKLILIGKGGDRKILTGEELQKFLKG